MQEILQKQGMIGGKQMRFRCRKTPINLLSIQVFGAGGSPQLQSKSITPSTSTQHVYPSSRFDGLSQVTVNGDSNLISSNIRKGKSIFGISGVFPNYSSQKTQLKIATTKTSNSLYFKIPNTVDFLNCRITIDRFNATTGGYQLHFEDAFENLFNRMLKAVYLGIDITQQDNMISNRLHGYVYKSRIQYYAESTYYFSTTNAFESNDILMKCIKESDGGISISVPNWTPQADVYNGSTTIDSSLSNITYPWWSNIYIYYGNF